MFRLIYGLCALTFMAFCNQGGAHDDNNAIALLSQDNVINIDFLENDLNVSITDNTGTEDESVSTMCRGHGEPLTLPLPSTDTGMLQNTHEFKSGIARRMSRFPNTGYLFLTEPEMTLALFTNEEAEDLRSLYKTLIPRARWELALALYSVFAEDMRYFKCLRNDVTLNSIARILGSEEIGSFLRVANWEGEPYVAFMNHWRENPEEVWSLYITTYARLSRYIGKKGLTGWKYRALSEEIQQDWARYISARIISGKPGNIFHYIRLVDRENFWSPKFSDAPFLIPAHNPLTLKILVGILEQYHIKKNDSVISLKEFLRNVKYKQIVNVNTALSEFYAQYATDVDEFKRIKWKRLTIDGEDALISINEHGIGIYDSHGIFKQLPYCSKTENGLCILD